MTVTTQMEQHTLCCDTPSCFPRTLGFDVLPLVLWHQNTGDWLSVLESRTCKITVLASGETFYFPHMVEVCSRGSTLCTCLAVEQRRELLPHKLFRSCTSSLLMTHLSSWEMCLIFLVHSLSNLVFPHSTLKSSLSVLHSQSLLGLGLPVRFYFCSVDRQSRQMSCMEESELIRSRVELRNTR